MNTASGEQVLARFSLPSEPGNEKLALARVADAVAAKGLTADQLDRLKTAVAETTMNAIEHGNHNRADLDVDVTVVENADGIAVSIVDRGGAHAPENDGHVELPDLEMKLAGLQSPRGWGLFLIRNMVDALDVSTDGDKHIVRLLIRADSSINEAHDHQGGPRAEQV